MRLVWLILVVVQHVQSQNSERTCPAKWIKFQNSCYRIYNRPVTFSAAEVGCQDDYKGRLAVVDSKEKSDFITKQFFTPDNKNRKNTWIALVRTKDTNVDSSFQWLDKSHVNFTNWQHGEPNNFWGVQYCVAIWSGPREAGTWYDYWCDTQIFALCERDAKSIQSEEQRQDLAPSAEEPKQDLAPSAEIPETESEVSKSSATWILLIVTSIVSVFMLIIIVVICLIADFSQAKRAVSAKTDVWFKRFSEDRISMGQSEINIINNNYSPSAKVLNN